MKHVLDEFKTFAMRGNVVDMAVGIILGGAFGKIVSSLVSDIIMPGVGLLIGGVNFTNLKIVLKHAVTNAKGEVIEPAVSINYGNFIQVTVDFIIISFAIFLLVKGINALSQLKEKEEQTNPAAPVVPDNIKLLTQIRDLLQQQNDKKEKDPHSTQES
ncbi:large-conductance mechanosensitive channel protein MscL [Parabacteroides pacaensis]|uniref:large-conductance mechanosensitive channel protein MscL n=1 Tax=Parabacteroides pacaensis TaxID=2086575 RepID=UPI000D109837|nr:large-conductance mechanosensitive channel protein MscL [Parabacteroides pacaensis]